jgi:hypothetical protein
LLEEHESGGRFGLILSVGTGADHVGEDRERDEEEGHPSLWEPTESGESGRVELGREGNAQESKRSQT